MSVVESLVAGLEHYIPGGESERKRVAIELLDELIRERAKGHLRTKFALQGLDRLVALQEMLRESLESQAVEDIKKVKPMRSSKPKKVDEQKETSLQDRGPQGGKGK